MIDQKIDLQCKTKLVLCQTHNRYTLNKYILNKPKQSFKNYTTYWLNNLIIRFLFSDSHFDTKINNPTINGIINDTTEKQSLLRIKHLQMFLPFLKRFNKRNTCISYYNVFEQICIWHLLQLNIDENPRFVDEKILTSRVYRKFFYVEEILVFEPILTNNIRRIIYT